MRQIVPYCVLAAGMCLAPLTMAAAAEPTASELLQQARDARAVWEEFPGFTARLSICLDEQVAEGELEVARDGAVKLSGVEPLREDFIRQQIEALVFHRMPGEPGATEAEFVEEPGRHPLGRLLRVAGDTMGSTYRVQGDVISEVNREMDPLALTISVLQFERNAQGKVLPTVYNVAFRTLKGQTLLASHTHVDRWTSVGGFDLPQQMLLLAGDHDERSVLKIDFSEHKLLDQKAQRASPPTAQ